MAYVKQIWEDGVTPCDAEHMNHIEDGIYENSNLDTEMSTISEKAVQNKTITNYIGEISNLNTTDKSKVVNAINEIYNQLGQGFKMYLDSNVVTINPTVDVYALVEASWGIWGFAGAEIGLNISTPEGATLVDFFTTHTNGHNTEAVPVTAVGKYILPAGGKYTFGVGASIGKLGGVKGNWIKAVTIPKMD